MTIDPMLYQKISGRSGDPSTRLGQALAQSSARQQERTAAKDRTYSQRRYGARMKARALMGIVGAIALLILVIMYSVTR